ncbi:MAG TPA: class I SAM-dependent methyltransferase [Candidatus Omnitrophota bacterium]|nr:class I SAM-dependent methyltransferase [Candidatus Omnitrophota bacterium]
MRIKRTHDEFYLQEDRRSTPKEYFKFISRYSFSFIESLENPSILDIGCATGDYLWYLSMIHKDARFYGMDVMHKLMVTAKSRLPQSVFFKGNIFTGQGLPSKKFDVVFMLGVHSIFDSHEPWINNLLKLVKSHGRIFVFGMFNPEPIDVLVKARYSITGKVWEPGWNVFSLLTLTHYLKKKKTKSSFIPWTIPIDIKKNNKDTLRSWTFKDKQGARLVVNGTQVLHHFYLLEIIPHARKKI